MMSHYTPKVNDYVKWKNIEGWVYFVDEEYVTIEILVKDKACDLGTFHKKEHVLVLCYHNQWKQLEYVTSRQCKYNNLVPLMELAS